MSPLRKFKSIFGLLFNAMFSTMQEFHFVYHLHKYIDDAKRMSSVVKLIFAENHPDSFRIQKKKKMIRNRILMEEEQPPES